MRNTIEMSDFEISRWYALYEAVNFIADECESRGIDFESIRLEPLYIKKYVEKTCDIFARRLQEQRADAEKQVEHGIYTAVAKRQKDAIYS